MEPKESSEVEEKTSKRARRKYNKLRKSPFNHMEKKTMVAGTIIVLGVAMAIYGVQSSRIGDRSVLHGFAEGHVHTRDWKRFSGWVGGTFVGMSTRIMNGLSSKTH